MVPLDLKPRKRTSSHRAAESKKARREEYFVVDDPATSSSSSTNSRSRITIKSCTGDSTGNSTNGIANDSVNDITGNSTTDITGNSTTDITASPKKRRRRNAPSTKNGAFRSAMRGSAPVSIAPRREVYSLINDPQCYISDSEFDASYSGLLALSEIIGDANFKGLQYSIIQQFPVRSYKLSEAPLVDLDEYRCCICLEEYVPGDLQKGISCFHWFHIECIDNWLSRSASCPICRISLHGDPVD